MDPATIITIKAIMTYATGPIVGLFAWMGKRLHNRIDTLESNLYEMDKVQAVHESKVKDIKEDVREINRKLDKILDRVSQSNG